MVCRGFQFSSNAGASHRGSGSLLYHYSSPFDIWRGVIFSRRIGIVIAICSTEFFVCPSLFVNLSFVFHY